MKLSIPSAVLILCVLLSPSAFTQQEPQLEPLTNQDVVRMVKAQLPAEVIISKIKKSRCHFDTAPSMLSELKYNGVPDAVLLAMVNAPYGLPSPEEKPADVKPEPKRQPATEEPRVRRNEDQTGEDEPELGTIQDIKSSSKVFVRAQDDDARSAIIDLLGGYEGVRVVNTAKDAEIILDYIILTRDVAPNYGPYAHGASMALKSQMRAYTFKPEGSKVIAWTETETFDVTNGFVLGASNEVNLTHHFVRALQKARGEETYSLRKLFQNSQKHKKELKAKKAQLDRTSHQTLSWFV